LDLRPRLRAPARLQHHAQNAVDAEPGVPEAGALVGPRVGEAAECDVEHPPPSGSPSTRAEMDIGPAADHFSRGAGSGNAAARRLANCLPERMERRFGLSPRQIRSVTQLLALPHQASPRLARRLRPTSD